jgi:hypothetical protein
MGFQVCHSHAYMVRMQVGWCRLAPCFISACWLTPLLRPLTAPSSFPGIMCVYLKPFGINLHVLSSAASFRCTCQAHPFITDISNLLLCKLHQVNLSGILQGNKSVSCGLRRSV